jgi:hypothetical protein
MQEQDGGHIIHALLVDWDDDGDLDILFGCNSGRLALRLNEGTRSAPAFSPDRTSVLVDGKPFGVPRGATPSPSFVDWDGDGLRDLVVGLIAEKRVIWHRNIGRKGQPKFGKQETILDLKTSDKPRAWNRLSVADYNGDGRLDALVKEYLPVGYVTRVQLPVTAPEVQIEHLRFYVDGESDTDDKQPRVLLVVRGKAGAEKVKTTTTFSIQASATQRLLDL